MIGDESEIAKLQDFLQLPAHFALNRFAFESLFEPKAITTGQNDAQILQIKAQLRERFNISDSIKLLDFGAGKGRLLENILQSENKEGKEIIREMIDYVAFDYSDLDKEECLEIIKNDAASGKKKRSFTPRKKSGG